MDISTEMIKILSVGYVSSFNRITIHPLQSTGMENYEKRCKSNFPLLICPVSSPMSMSNCLPYCFLLHYSVIYGHIPVPLTIPSYEILPLYTQDIFLMHAQRHCWKISAELRQVVQTDLLAELGVSFRKKKKKNIDQKC